MQLETRCAPMLLSNLATLIGALCIVQCLLFDHPAFRQGCFQTAHTSFKVMPPHRGCIEQVNDRDMFLTSPSMQGLVGITSNPVLANGIAGLATSATAQATVEVRRFSESSCDCDFLLLRWLLRHLV